MNRRRKHSKHIGLRILFTAVAFLLSALVFALMWKHTMKDALEIIIVSVPVAVFGFAICWGDILDK